MAATIIDVLSNEVVARALFDVNVPGNLADIARLGRTCRLAYEALSPRVTKAIRLDIRHLGNQGVGRWREEVRAQVRSLEVSTSAWLRHEEIQAIYETLPLFPRLTSATLPPLNLQPTNPAVLAGLITLATLNLAVTTHVFSTFVAALSAVRRVRLDISGASTMPSSQKMRGFVPVPSITPSALSQEIMLVNTKSHTYDILPLDSIFPNARKVIIYAEKGHHGGLLNAYLPVLCRLLRLEEIAIFEGRRFGHCSCASGAEDEPDVDAISVAVDRLRDTCESLRRVAVGGLYNDEYESWDGNGYWEVKTVCTSFDGPRGEPNMVIKDGGWTGDRRYWERKLDWGLRL